MPPVLTPPQRIAHQGKPYELKHIYDYTDEAGKHVFACCRYEPMAPDPSLDRKTFRQGHQNGEGWVPNLDGVQKVLYHLQQVEWAVLDEMPLYLPEGEKDVERLEGLELYATTAPCGAAAEWDISYSETLTGARVVVILDNDDPGRLRGKKIVAGLRGYAHSVQVLDICSLWPEAPDHADISDWLDQGGTREALEEYLYPLPIEEEEEENRESKPGKQSKAGKAGKAGKVPENGASVYSVYSVSPLSPPQNERVNGEKTADDVEWHRKTLQEVETKYVDWLVPQFLYRGGITVMSGVSGCGKTTFAMEIVQALSEGGLLWGKAVEPGFNTLWLDFDQPQGRLKAKWEEFYGDDMARYCSFLEENFPLDGIWDDVYVRYIQEWNIHLLIVDTLGDWLDLLDMDNTGKVRKAMARIRRLVKLTNVAIFAIGHPAKNRADPDTVNAYANSVMFGAKADLVANLDSKAKDNDGWLYVNKNRDGEGNWSQRFLKRDGQFLPMGEDMRPESLETKLLAFLEEKSGATRQEIIYHFEGKHSRGRIDVRLKCLVDKGRVVKEFRQPHNVVYYRLP